MDALEPSPGEAQGARALAGALRESSGASMFATVGEMVVHYSLAGPPGAPALVFIHSLGTDLRIWDRVLPVFEPDYEIVRYDLRGHGLSDCPRGPYQLEHFVADLRGLLDHLGIRQAVLVGISIGGVIAMETSARHPDAVRGLVLAGTASRIGTATHWQERIEAVRGTGLARFASTALDLWFTEPFRSGERARAQGFANMLARTPAEGYAASCAALGVSDLTERVPTIRVPALVMTGEQDRATPPEQGRSLAAALPGGRFELIPGAAHLPCIEQPEEMAAGIHRFLKEQRYG